jgi:hypothetical protein
LNPDTYVPFLSRVLSLLHRSLSEFEAAILCHSEVTVITVACVQAFKAIFSSGISSVFLRAAETDSLFSVNSSVPALCSCTSSAFFIRVLVGEYKYVAPESISLSNSIPFDSTIQVLQDLYGPARADFILRGMNSSTGPRQVGSSSDDNPTTALICSALDAVSTLGITVCSADILEKIWRGLLVPHLLASESPNICFALAEALMRTSYTGKLLYIQNSYFFFS